MSKDSLAIFFPCRMIEKKTNVALKAIRDIDEILLFFFIIIIIEATKRKKKTNENTINYRIIKNTHLFII
jgi:hypothetical protein